MHADTSFWKVITPVSPTTLQAIAPLGSVLGEVAEQAYLLAIETRKTVFFYFNECMTIVKP